jgi:hypothetical protein
LLLRNKDYVHAEFYSPMLSSLLSSSSAAAAAAELMWSSSLYQIKPFSDSSSLFYMLQFLKLMSTNPGEICSNMYFMLYF